MAGPDPRSNTYEEVPDELKELLKDLDIEKGKQIHARVPRQRLLRDHENNLKLLRAGTLPPRNYVLPLPYPPAKEVSLSSCKSTRIENLLIGVRDPKEIIVLRTIAEPYVHTSSITIVEDEAGDTARLTVSNLEDSPIDPIIPNGAVLAVRQPSWSKTSKGGYHIHVDHPTDIEILHFGHELISTDWHDDRVINESSTASSLKKEGDMMFLKKKFRKALEKYDAGLIQLSPDSDPRTEIDFYRKRCGVNLVLLRFDNAATDLAKAIAVHARSDPELSSTDLANVSKMESWLHDHSTEDPQQISTKLPRPLKDLAARIKFDVGIWQSEAKYDLSTISAYVGPLTLHVDAVNYTSDTEVKQTESHGRGLFAKKAFKSGDIIMVEKAFALPGYFMGDSSTECSLFSLGDETAADRAGAMLFKELVQKLRANPSLRKPFFEMDDGGYWAEKGWEVGPEEDTPVDVFRIEHIRRRNCFAAPIRSSDLLSRNGAVRNGFWIHTSYINHSCLPNSVRTFMGDVMVLRATRDMFIGEEVTAQYVSPELTTKSRQDVFQGTWGFTCDCPLCALDGGAGQPSESDRMALFEELKGSAQKAEKGATNTALKKFAKRLRDLEALYPEEAYADSPRLCLVHPTLFLTEAWRNAKSHDRIIECATKLLRNFGVFVTAHDNSFEVVKNSGLINVECVRALKYMAEANKAKGEDELAASTMETAKVWFRVITGSDIGSEDFLKLE